MSAEENKTVALTRAGTLDDGWYIWQAEGPVMEGRAVWKGGDFFVLLPAEWYLRWSDEIQAEADARRGDGES